MIRTAALVAAVGLAATGVQAETIAYWNFNGLGSPTATQIDADQGSGRLYAEGSFGSSVWLANQYTNFTGTTLNAQDGDVAGRSLALVNQTANGQSIVFAFSMAGFRNLEVSYATQRTGTGFNSQVWEWSTDGVSFFNFDTVGVSDIPSSFGVVNLASLAALDNAETAFLRLTVDGASSVSGNNRLDNVLFQAAIIPLPPAAWAGLVMIGGIAGVRRLRRR
ncbi:MAG: hypothetical protein LAT64_09335 [Phycisphaerales bacterium]|nr:hypothetical protein [Planctomycetota bacterium]MCH8508952.1 hypothetical protein [Phycisphaerales bacterium]